MTELNFPDGDAMKLWDMRISGFKPNDMVMISLIGELTTGRWQIYPSPEVHPKKYEWRWVRDLQICLVYDSTCNKDKVKAIALEIAKNKSIGDQAKTDGFTGSLFLWNTSLKAGAHMKHTPEIHGDPSLMLPNHPEEIVYRSLSPYEVPFFLDIESPI
jgi:hypothetical protein